ncbi:MAG: alpha/beta hydrolase [Sphingobacteriaceae bacterium]|nr:alpha/beta hydrolase [Sphingobacteriaceae bacterium]
MLKKSSIQNASLQWYDKGAGPCLVLLHGFTESHRCWLAAAEALAGQYRVLVPDLPGSGNSSLLSDGSADLGATAKLLWQWLSDLHIEKCVVVGHSMGGYVALEMLAAVPQRLLGIGLFHSHPLGDDEGKKGNRDRTIELIEKRGSKDFLHGFIPNLFAPAHRESMSEIIELLEKQAAEQSVAAYVAQTRAMRDRESRLELLVQSPLPKLVVLGAQDPILPQSVGLDFAAQLDRCQLELLPEAGHMGMYECRPKTAEILAEFMSWV